MSSATGENGEIAEGGSVAMCARLPTIAAVWFAIVLGPGSLFLPAALFDTAVLASGISYLVPAATPPLGQGARLLIAAMAAGGGAAAGFWIARRATRRVWAMQDIGTRPSHTGTLSLEEDFEQERPKPAVSGTRDAPGRPDTQVDAALREALLSLRRASGTAP